MSKFEETEAMINMFTYTLDNIGTDETTVNQAYRVIFATAICDIAKSLSIIADAVSDFEEE